MEAPEAMDVTVTEDTLTVDLAETRGHHGLQDDPTPLVSYPRLVHATPQERGNWELHAAGQHIHWPDLDEDLSVEGLLAGRKSGDDYVYREVLKISEEEYDKLKALRPDRNGLRAVRDVGGEGADACGTGLLLSQEWLLLI